MKKNFDWSHGILSKGWCRFPRNFFILKNRLNLESFDLVVLQYLICRYPVEQIIDSVMARDLGTSRARINRSTKRLSQLRIIEVTKVLWQGRLIKKYNLIPLAQLSQRISAEVRQEKKAKKEQKQRQKVREVENALTVDSSPLIISAEDGKFFEKFNKKSE